MIETSQRSNTKFQQHYLRVKQAGTGPSPRHIQGSKVAKGLPSVNLQYSKIEKPKKVDRVARRGPPTRAPGALKGGTLLKLSTFLSQLKGDPLAKKQTFEKSLTMPKNRNEGPFGNFKHPFCCKISKKLKGGPFGEKNNLE